MSHNPFDAEAARVLSLLRAHGLMVATAESCTGGLVAGALTAIPGSSDVVDRGFVTYSNAAKTEPVARAMAEGALAHSRAGVSVAITGIAGPGGGSDAKPVGLVHFGASRRDRPTVHLERRYGDLGRDGIRAAAVADALALLAGLVP
jgi:nicotinamide-nucleotide amidase